MTQIDPKYAAETLHNIASALGPPDTSGQVTDALAKQQQAGMSQGVGSSIGNSVGASGGMAGGMYEGYAISQEYGVNGHPGIDIAIPVGTRLVSPISGTVTHAADDDPGGYGSWVEITGADGTVIRYGHLSGIGVSVGQHVDVGMPIGASGGQPGTPGAGNATGPHLHFEVHQGSTGVSPDSFLAGGWQILG